MGIGKILFMEANIGISRIAQRVHSLHNAITPKDIFSNLKKVLRKISRYRLILLLFSMILTIVVWEGLVFLFNLPPFILPSPLLVFQRFGQVILDGSLFTHIFITLGEILLGLFFGVLTATILGYFLSRSMIIEQIIGPYIVASQAIPTIAIAPLLIIWFGPGIFSKILICALTVFFPILINTIVGLRSVPTKLYDLMNSLQATRWQIFKYLEVPSSLPVFLGGLRVGATLSVIGAVVGEFVGADRGLGFLINVARGQYDTALVFVAVFVLVGMALALYGVVAWSETFFLSWQQKKS